MRAVERIRPLVCLFATALSLGLAAQSKGAAPPQLQAAATAPSADFSGEPAVIVRSRSVVTMHADGTGVRENTLAIRLQTEAAVRQFGVVAIAFAGSAEHAEFLYARVRHPDGTVAETPVTGALEQPAQVTREAPFYSDLKNLQLPIKSLAVGDTLEWSNRVTRTTPEVPGQVYGQDAFTQDAVALDESFELHVPAALHLTVWTNPNIAQPKDTVQGADRVILWNAKHLERSTGPAADVAKKKPLSAEADLASRKGPLPSFAWTTFASWEAVGDWYRDLQSDRVKPDAAITARVAQLTAGKTTDADKAQAIYEYVATEIRYIGVAFGIGRYQPHTAAEVFANQYGDCKDKHTLLAAMLTSIGLHPEAVLIGAGVRFNPAVPSPAAFNHLITQVSLDGKPVWLDTTAEVAPWGTLMPLIRDQQALVITPSGPSTVQQTPATAPFPAFATLAATETLDKDLTSEARISLTFHDDDELALRAVLRQISPAQYPEFLQRFVAAMGFGGTATDPEISRPDDLDQPLTLTYKYKRVKEADWGENRVTEPFWPISLPGVDPKEPPTSSIELGSPRTETSTVEIKLPEGWSVELPEAIHAKAPFATADTTFHLNHGVVTAERKLTVLQPRIPAADWKSYKSWSEEGQVTGYPFLQLIKAGAKVSDAAASESASPAAARNGTAERLVTQATDALRQMDTATARRLLDEAKGLNPQQRMLWGEYAYASYLLGEISKATEEVNKELALHPDELQMNGLLASLQQTRGEHDAALATLRRWAAAAPDNPAPALALITELHKLERNEEAIEQGKAALARLGSTDTDLTQLRFVLADVQENSGHKADAAATILPLKGVVTDPSQQNSVAYLLADAKVDLPGDEASERAVLDKLDTETNDWTLDEAAPVLASKTSLLIASWDTMGWILYQQGHLPEARTYIAAAWQNAPRRDLLDHLHAVDAALHQSTKEEAVGDQSRRTFALGPAHARRGTAELKLLLADGQVLRAEPAFDSPAPGTHPSAAPALRDAPELVKVADLHALFPPGSKARLVRKGIVNCSGATCQLILEPLAFR